MNSSSHILEYFLFLKNRNKDQFMKDKKQNNTYNLLFIVCLNLQGVV